MTDPGFDYIDAITEHSVGFAAAAEGNLDARVEHCPGWTVADLVKHLTEVHWFWATIAEERLTEPPGDARRPPGVPKERLIDTFREGADRLVKVLRAAKGDDLVWTWAAGQQNVAFITRHQVQEAAVHHWDSAHAAGEALAIEPLVASDSISEFLTFSVSSEDDPAEPPRPALGGQFSLYAIDTGTSWTISDGQAAGTVRFEQNEKETPPAVSATSSDLLLWLYNRVDLGTTAVQADVIERFRALCFAD